MNKRWITLVSVAGATALCGFSGLGTANAADSIAGPPTRGSPLAKDELSDSQILGVTDVANGGEVEQGDIAEKRGHAPAVKSFAQMMVNDHFAAKKEGAEIASKLGLKLAPSEERARLQQNGDQVLTDLRKADKDDFDRTYLKAQIKEHESVLKLIDSDLMPNANAPQIKTLLGDMRTHVEHHLSVAHSALDELSKSK
ncbi:MAG TPA: DUF4142 domain-containing protein [Polyangiaceae bacterium]|jgi:putative membrane protein|nr:DUF4142 domain-containing protein [Polyangiaceae bacterium]